MKHFEKQKSLVIAVLLCFCMTFAGIKSYAGPEPDSAYIFSYATEKNSGHNGLHFAWSLDRESWHPIGPEFSYIRCDYGRWGSEKRMLKPFLIPGISGGWHLVWSMNEREGAFAHAYSEDLVKWGRQSYPRFQEDKNCMDIEVTFDKGSGLYVVSWLSFIPHQEAQAYYTTTKDFKEFSPVKKGDAATRNELRQDVTINGNTEEGIIYKVPWHTIDNLISKYKIASYNDRLYGESAKDDGTRFAGLENVSAAIHVNTQAAKPISDLLLGIFFEDISYAADGGLYAELVQNRDFEYMAGENGRDPDWKNDKAWSVNGENMDFSIQSENPIHPNNPHYAVLKVNDPGAAFVNSGYDGIVLKAGDKYDFSLFARTLKGKNGKLKVRLAGENGEIYAEKNVGNLSGEWKQYKTVLTAGADVKNARLEVIPQTEGEIALDMISLFPQKTFKGRKNGLREDLAQVIADMKPRFMRFPGGCVAHGDGLDNIYHWKYTVGPLEARKPLKNLWGYHQTMGLGYYEYFLFCEDMGAEPVPIVAAGVPCQNSGHSHRGGGQQGGIPMEEMDAYVRDILDLIEYANGDARTTEWGKKRAEAGHPKPFNLKYLGVGNEDLITDIFEERFTMIYNAVKEKHPEIKVIGTAGPFFEGTDYEEGWEIANKLDIPLIDEHYYVSPGWYIHNQDYYDKYDRNKTKVYLGEYAAHVPGRHNNMETALAEALHLVAMERNGDVVSMTSYAPLLAKDGYTRWNPDLIYFNNSEVKPTAGYHVQKLFGHHAGDTYLSGKINVSDGRSDVIKRIASSVVKDSKTGDIIVKMVNFLPVPVRTSVVLEGIANVAPNAKRIVLSGQPDDRKAMPVENTIAVSPEFDCELEPYSFTVIRMQAE